MKKVLFICTIGMFLNINLLRSQPAEFYKKVDRVIWIVKDVDHTVQGWKDLGFKQIQEYGEVRLEDSNQSGLDVKIASANLGGAHVTWIQPVSWNNVFSYFLDNHGDGAFSLMYRVKNLQTMQDEINRLNTVHVKVLDQGKVETDDGIVSYVFMDTPKQGKYSLGLLTGPDDLDQTTGENIMNMRFNQYAFAIKDGKQVSAYWSKLGFPPFEFTHSDVWDKEYYGQNADFDMNLGWQRHADIVFEWCIPTKSPTVYEDHIKSHGEGIQHFGFAVTDMENAIKYFNEKGFVISMSGGWGEKGKSGSGRFAYVNTEKIGGETIELLWNYPD